MPHVKHPVSNPAHGCAPKLHLIGFVLCSKPELKTAQDVQFLNKLLELKIGHGRPIFKPYEVGSPSGEHPLPCTRNAAFPARGRTRSPSGESGTSYGLGQVNSMVTGNEIGNGK